MAALRLGLGLLIDGGDLVLVPVGPSGLACPGFGSGRLGSHVLDHRWGELVRACANGGTFLPPRLQSTDRAATSRGLISRGLISRGSCV